MPPKNAVTFACLTVLSVAMASDRLMSHETVTTTVTYDREIVRVLKSKCLACHSENNLGMALTSYEQTRPWARAIEDEALRRHMPPWRAVSGYGQFANDIALTNRELQFLVSWVQGNGPKNKDQRLIVNIGAPTSPKERLHLDFLKWELGKPDVVKPVRFTSDSMPSIRRAIIDVGFTSDRWLRGLAFQPADRRNLAATFFTVQENGQWLATWTPWYTHTALPEDTAYLLPRGSHIVAESYYFHEPAPTDDRGSLGLYFATAKPKHSPVSLTIIAKPQPAVSPSQEKFTGSATLKAETSVLALIPEVRRSLQSIEVSARRPDGGVEVLLLVRDPLPDWPTSYVLRTPVQLPEGTQLVVTSYSGAAATAVPEFKMMISITTAA